MVQVTLYREVYNSDQSHAEHSRNQALGIVGTDAMKIVIAIDINEGDFGIE